ncbi:hypothetical protein [Arthrobacter bussei]|nr:hypothetical protein [Arthrobacter bussei]
MTSSLITELDGIIDTGAPVISSPRSNCPLPAVLFPWRCGCPPL